MRKVVNVCLEKRSTVSFIRCLAITGTVPGKENDQKMLDEIEDLRCKNVNLEYFIIKTTVAGKDDDAYEVIDGQQRLTIILLIFLALRHVFKEKNDFEKIILLRD